MAAGARQLAEARGTDLPPDYMDRIIRTQQRHAQLKRWETDGKVEVEHASILSHDKRSTINRIYVHVLKDKKRFTAFEDLLAEQTGGWPSEVLVANIALALQSEGLL